VTIIKQVMAVDDTKKEIATAGEHSAELQLGWFFYLLNRLDRLENKTAERV